MSHLTGLYSMQFEAGVILGAATVVEFVAAKASRFNSFPHPESL
jgi:hypothetical protein